MDVTHLYTISWVLLHLTWSVSGTQIILERNGYSNIVIAISPDVASNQADTIIQNLKVVKHFNRKLDGLIKQILKSS